MNFHYHFILFLLNAVFQQFNILSLMFSLITLDNLLPENNIGFDCSGFFFDFISAADCCDNNSLIIFLKTNVRLSDLPNNNLT